MASHIGRQPALERLFELRNGNRAFAGNRQSLAAGRTEPRQRHPGCFGALGDEIGVLAGHDIAALILAEPECVGGKRRRILILAPPGLTETAQRAGHIPDAVNVPWAQAANEDGTFKSADSLQQLYGGKGVTGANDVIAYCRIGERSSHTWFVLKYLLGYGKVKNYDGSWTEWGNLVGAPIVNSSAAAAATN